MSKYTGMPSRTVCKYEDQCSVCFEAIPKGTCISKLFNLRSHKQCEAGLMQKYAESSAKGRRPSAAKSL